VQRPSDVGPVGVLGDVAAGAGPQRVQDQVLVDVRGEHDDRDVRVLGGQPPGGRDAVEDRHPQVEQDRVRPVRGDLLHRLLAVGGRADHLDVGQPTEQ
jgi:hypothetical protein